MRDLARRDWPPVGRIETSLCCRCLTHTLMQGQGEEKEGDAWAHGEFLGCI